MNKFQIEIFISGPTEDIHFSKDAFVHIWGPRTFDIRCFCKTTKNFHKCAVTQYLE